MKKIIARGNTPGNSLIFVLKGEVVIFPEHENVS